MRRALIVLAAAAALLVVAAVASPWWTGWAVAQIGGRFGLTFARAESEGYRRLVLHDVRIERPNVRISVDRIESDGLILWLWRRATGAPAALIAGDWRADVISANGAPAKNTPRGWQPMREQLARAGDRLAQWLPHARAGCGVVAWPTGVLKIDSAEWHDRVLVSPAVTWGRLTAAVRVEVPADGEIVARAEDGDGTLALQGSATDVRATLTWWNQKAEGEARFGAEGWRPEYASVRAEAWTLPAERLKLGRQYAHVRGDARIEWKDGVLTADVAARGEPREGQEAPPLEIAVHGRGEAGGFVAEQLRVEIPGVTARLSDPVRIDRNGHIISPPARFVAEADLARLPWLTAVGNVTGTGAIAANAEGFPRVDFELNGRGIELYRPKLDIAARGALDWPVLRVDAVQLRSENGERLVAEGAWDFRERRASDVKVNGRLGRDLMGDWMPATLLWDDAEFEAEVAGPAAALEHRGHLVVTGFRSGPWHLGRVETDWIGRGPVLEKVSLAAAAGATRVTAHGSADADKMRIEAAEFVRGENVRLRLGAPAEVRWTERRFRALDFVGDSARISMSGALGPAGELGLTLHHVSSEWWRDLVDLPAAKWTVHELELTGVWDRGPARYAAKGRGQVEFGRGQAAQIVTQFEGSADGLELNSLDVTEGQGPIVRATGHLPVIVSPGGPRWFQLDETARLEIEAETSSNPEFWRELTQITGVELTDPEVRVNLTGSWQRPRGEATVRAASVAVTNDRLRRNWPRIEALDARLVGLNDGVRLERFSAVVEGQQLRAQGWLPLSMERWREIREDPRTLAKSGDLHVEVPDADLAAVAKYFPDILAPKGRLQVDVTLRSDATLNGFVRVRDATSRPLGPLGVLQDVNAEIRLRDRSVELPAVSARMGGQAVTLEGRATLPKEGRALLDLQLKGRNLPFVRRMGLLLRGDLDLTLKTPASGPTAIGGTVRLRDSLFLTDVRSLLPSGQKGSAARPPYFSIEAQPLNGWRLDVGIQGENFMRVRTPIFDGAASARLHLEGSLGEPRLRGEIVVGRGTVKLPFATFAVQQGYVRFAPEQADPQLLVNARSRRFGYDVRMELSGPATAPNLTFSSSPPLDAEQVLLMVMAGQPPNDEITTTDRQRIARFGAFFGQSLLGSLGGDATGADRLTISSGESISAQGRETYSIEYRLNPRWAITGEYDEFDEYYGGLKWRVYPRGGGEDEED